MPDEVSIQERFRLLAGEWEEQSRYLSNTAQMAMLKPYQRIIGLGLLVVPLILEDLQREPDQWFWALESITEQDPVPPEGKGKSDFVCFGKIRHSPLIITRSRGEDLH